MVDGQEQEEARLKYAALMRCPKCGEPLLQVEICEIPIERCSLCDGVWLDRGELELILDRQQADDSWLARFLKKLH